MVNWAWCERCGEQVGAVSPAVPSKTCADCSEKVAKDAELSRLRARVTELEGAPVAEVIREPDGAIGATYVRIRPETPGHSTAPQPASVFFYCTSDGSVVGVKTVLLTPRALLAPAPETKPAHICQIARATSGASDCGLSPCEDAAVHRDRPKPCATCGYFHGECVAFVLNSYVCTRVQGHDGEHVACAKDGGA